jgi:hypothetical protein
MRHVPGTMSLALYPTLRISDTVIRFARFADNQNMYDMGAKETVFRMGSGSMNNDSRRPLVLNAARVHRLMSVQLSSLSLMC